MTNPATGEFLRHVPFATAEDVDAAAAAALEAWPAWRNAPPLRRARVLMRFRELMEAHKIRKQLGSRFALIEILGVCHAADQCRNCAKGE